MNEQEATYASRNSLLVMDSAWAELVIFDSVACQDNWVVQDSMFGVLRIKLDGKMEIIR